jgi:hypothetical protein
MAHKESVHEQAVFFSDINGAGNILSASFFDKKIDDTLFEILRIRAPQWLEKQGC